ncbi:UNKNOWN [Stylonychia lemnae]|uniref:Uncharacterized protein n=1 Tax=Stylonychia lemnae TaxID=5949 RepID=A0A078AYL6_STYLE|nr:UNKNOWN [Stylonychia lemnae]|eukprot:CDW87259.1 UNKNOWN [Stylonychia lemnae]
MQKNQYAHFQAGYNIQQRVKGDEKYRDYAEYAKKIEAIGRTTEWHEGHSKFEVWRKNNANERQIVQELSQANQELKILRHERLKQLYQTEMEQYEKELNDMGYAILKDRL